MEKTTIVFYQLKADYRDADIGARLNYVPSGKLLTFYFRLFT